MKRGVIIHHSAGTDDNVTRDWDAICRHHTEIKGWRPPCGYHFGFEYHQGRVRLQIGRPPQQSGAHCIPCNRTHLGIVLIGNFQETVPPPEMVSDVREFVGSLQRGGWVGPEVLPHRNRWATLCPGDNLIEALSDIWTETPKAA